MLILHNAKIRTQDYQFPYANALAIDKGRIIAIGKDDDVCSLSKAGDKIQDLEGHTIWPGLTDSHIHIQHVAGNSQKLLCEHLSKAECIRLVAEKASQTKPGKWILGHGWDHNSWDDGYGNASDLDSVAKQNPVFLSSKSLHSAWVNSKALEIAGIGPDSHDPPGGLIVRDESGRPSGILIDTAIRLVELIIPNPDENELAEEILKIQKDLHKSGITAVHDFDRFLDIQAFRVLRKTEQLALRIEMSIALDDLKLYISEIEENGTGDETIHIGNLKLFADGALGSRTAAMFHPYEGSEDECGLLIRSMDEIVEFGKIKSLPGLSIHAIGDHANHIVLDSYEEIRRWEKEENIGARRHRIEHVQLLHPNDFSRFFELDIIASMQPLHAISDQYMADEHWGKRCQNAYAWNKLLKSNARLIFGSDSPVETYSPFWGLEAATTRTRWYPPVSESSWYQEESISLENALNAYTIGPAYASKNQDCLGKLAPGYFADLIVLPIDPFITPPEGLHSTKPLATMVNGDWVFQDSDW